VSDVRKLGEAMKQVVSDAYEAEEGVAAKSALMNANRRRAFEYVAWHPGATATEVARALDASDPTAAWHLRKLVDAGYVQETRLPRARVYCVASLGLAQAEITGLAALSNADAARAFTSVVTTPGLTGTQIADRMGASSARASLRSLIAANLVVAVTDGRFRRYYAGAGVAAIERTSARRLRDFGRRLVRKLERDRLSPEARRAPGDVLEIDLRFGDERATLRLPAGSLLAGRLA